MKDNVFELNIEDYPVGHQIVKYVQFPSFYGLQDVQAPIAIHRASEAISPCVVVTACVHGDEINGLRIAQSLIRKKVRLKKGTLIIIPVVNIYGFLNKQRYLPDRKDLNRCFPGVEKGSFGSRFAHFIFNNLIKYGDVFIDLHSGPPGRFNIPQIRCDLSNKKNKKLVNTLSIPLVVNSSLRDGSFRGSIEALGKPCIVFEGGEGLRIDEVVAKYGMNLIKSVLSSMKMISSKKEFSTEKMIINKTKWVRAKEGGLLINKVKQGRSASKGEVIGELRKITGELISRITLEEAGVVLGVSKSSLIMAGDALYNIGFFSKNVKTDDDNFYDYFDLEME